MDVGRFEGVQSGIAERTELASGSGTTAVSFESVRSVESVESVVGVTGGYGSTLLAAVSAAVLLVVAVGALVVYRRMHFYQGTDSGKTRSSEDLTGDRGRVTETVTDRENEVSVVPDYPIESPSRDEVATKVKDALDEADIEIPYPHRTIEFFDMAEQAA